MELSNNEKYLGNINRVYANLTDGNKPLSVIEPTSAVPGSIFLKENGCSLVKEGSALTVVSARYINAIINYCERNKLTSPVSKTASANIEESANEITKGAEGIVATADLVL